MERALNPDLIRQALGQHNSLPSVEELSNLIAQAELATLLGKSEVNPSLIETAWYLHAVASSKHALGLYGLNRQRSAFSVAAHIFDLAIKNPEWGRIDKLNFCFAAQIAYLRSNLDPNAIAIYNQEAKSTLSDVSLFTDSTYVSLCCGVAFLGFDVNYIYSTTNIIRTEINRIETEWGLADFFSLPCGSAAGVALATRDLITYLLYGRKDILERAREVLRRAVLSESSAEDQISRWIAAHLLNLSFDLEASSAWSVLSPDSNLSVVKAFVMGQPRVLTLWPPQIELLKPNDANASSPLSHDVKRLFLSTPTSSGKTLLAQLLITSHFSTQKSSVYYIAPTRSLCREVRLALESRLRFLGKEIVDGLPEGDWLSEILSPEPSVEVMTPERLSYLLHSDSAKVLSEVGLFIFDEVHNIGDQGRGWTLELDIAFLHFMTTGQHQRIVLMSAAVGNQNHFVKWVGGDSKTFIHSSSDWRGPRRIHAIYTTHKDQNSPRQGTIKSAKYSRRITYSLFGQLDVRISQTGKTDSLRTTETIGDLTLKEVKGNGGWEKDGDKSTPFYKLLVPIITHFAEMGPVLVIESTRPATVRMAKAIAETQPLAESVPLKAILDLVEARLGAQHPLRQVLQNGVAYHHGSLPSEIRVAIEEAVTGGHIKYLVATTTMTEGVNLPVKSVVIASLGSHTSSGYNEYITGSKLINAIGRAGRATKETEGIVVLALQSAPSQTDFERLSPKDDDLKILSMLATKRALDELAHFEEGQRNLEDSVFEIANSAVSDFFSFIWFIAAELEKRSPESLTSEKIESILNSTLGWTQLEQPEKEKWLALAAAVLNRYKATDEKMRRRWAAAGTSISSSSKIEIVARSLADSTKTNPPPQEPITLVKYILSDGRLEQLLALLESPKVSIFAQRAGKNRTEIDISIEGLLIDWVHGIGLLQIADKHLALVTDVDYRFEQLGDLLNKYFEVFFPWVLGTLISWTNQFLADENIPIVFPKTISAYVRWGVGNQQALELMARGLNSRDLAMRIAAVWAGPGLKLDILSWLRQLSLSEWQKLFSASAAELKFLLEFCRDKKGAVAELLIDETTSIKAETDLKELPLTEVRLSPLDNTELSSIGVWQDKKLIGKIASRDQVDILAIISSSGFDYAAFFSVTSGIGTLKINLINLT